MKNQLLSAMILALPMLAKAQQSGPVPTVLTDKNGIIQAMEFSDNAPSPTDQEFMRQYLKISADDRFEKANDKQRSPGNTDDHFDQFYKGIKVDGAGYNFHYKKGKLFYAHGHFVKIENLDIISSINSERAKELFAQYKQIPASEISDFTSELLVKEIASADSAAYLVFEIYLHSNAPVNDEIGYVDAKTGEVLATEQIFSHSSPHVKIIQPKITQTTTPALKRALNPANGNFATRYSGAKTGSTDKDGLKYRLLDETRGAVIHTWNMQGSFDFDARVELLDNDNIWTAAEHAANENDMGLDIHWALQKIYDRLNTVHAVNSFNDPVAGAGFPINACIRYGSNNDSRDNAGWAAALKFLVFGDGAILFRPMASVDVVAHEYGHGITDFQIGWGNSGDQGAFNEGLSDIWGAIMQHRITGGNIWQVGEQITINNPCARDMQNTNLPNVLRPMANTFSSGQYNANSGNPGIDKYVRSGVLSHWAYLLANGGSGTNDVGTAYNVQGQGMDLLENLIVRAVFGNFLDNSTTYLQVRTGMVNAAKALCGNQNGVLVQQVENAWKAVNVGAATQSVISGPDHLCPNATYTIANLPAGSTVAWVSSNAAGVTISNAGSAARVGNFHGNVTLTATVSGGCGKLVLTKAISVGKPVATNIAINAPDKCAGTSQLVVAAINGNPTNMKWSVTSGNAPNASLSDFANGSASFFTNTPDCYGLTLSMTNTCGAATTGTTICIDNCFAGSKVYPNPARDLVTIEFEHAESLHALPEQIYLYSEHSTVPVRSVSIREVFENNAFRDGNKIAFRVSDLPRGIYYVHIIPGKNSGQKSEHIRIVLE
jgi:bacillolysin